MASEEDPTTQELRLAQADRERRERERAEQAPTEEDERAAERRAEKAAYLKEKLEEQDAATDG